MYDRIFACTGDELFLPGMAVITLNVIGDAATNVIVSFKEKVLNKDVYYK